MIGHLFTFRIFAGALGALLFGWLAFALLARLSAIPFELFFGPKEQDGWLILALVAVWALAIALIGWTMGRICSAFWRDKLDRRDKILGIALLICFVSPLCVAGQFGVLMAAFLFAVLWFPFRRGCDRDPNWQRFFGWPIA